MRPIQIVVQSAAVLPLPMQLKLRPIKRILFQVKARNTNALSASMINIKLEKLVILAVFYLVFSRSSPKNSRS